MQDLAADPAFDLEARSTCGQIFGGDDTGADSAGLVEVLAGRPLVRLALIVAQGPVVEDRVAKDMVQRVVFGDMAPARADDDHQFGLVIQLVRTARSHHRLSCRHDRIACAHEDRRILRNLIAAFLDVLDIVETQAEDLAR